MLYLLLIKNHVTLTFHSAVCVEIIINAILGLFFTFTGVWLLVFLHSCLFTLLIQNILLQKIVNAQSLFVFLLLCIVCTTTLHP